MAYVKAKETWRTILTERQRAALFDLPSNETALLRHYTLADDDIEHIRARRRSQSRLGFALQLCVFRYPGRLLTAEDVIPAAVIKFIVDLHRFRSGFLRAILAIKETGYGQRHFRPSNTATLTQRQLAGCIELGPRRQTSPRFCQRCTLFKPPVSSAKVHMVRPA